MTVGPCILNGVEDQDGRPTGRGEMPGRLKSFHLVAQRFPPLRTCGEAAAPAETHPAPSAEVVDCDADRHARNVAFEYSDRSLRSS